MLMVAMRRATSPEGPTRSACDDPKGIEVVEAQPAVTNTPPNLSTFDGRLLNGLDFCRKVYDLFDQIQNGPDGVERLRLRKTPIDKKLTEELIPIARYVQARYQEGRCVRVRWVSGNQPYDAVLLSSGNMVAHGGVLSALRGLDPRQPSPPDPAFRERRPLMLLNKRRLTKTSSELSTGRRPQVLVETGTRLGQQQRGAVS